MTNPWTTSTTNLAALSADDAAAWTQFVADRQPFLRALLTRLGVATADVDTVAQEALMACWQTVRAGRYRRELGRLRAWLTAIATRKAQMFLRGQRRAAHHVAVVGDTALENLTPTDRRGDDGLDPERLQMALRALQEASAERTWRIFAAVVLQGRPRSTVAAESGISENAVSLIKIRMLRRLRALCGRPGHEMP